MKRILFVDDEKRVLDGLRRMLRPMRKEWEMVFVESGEEALRKMEEAPFDVIVSDMRMPGMDGVQLLGEVRRRHPETIRLALSGHSDMAMLLESVKATHQFLSKPCDAETLKATVARALGLKALLARQDLAVLIARIDALPSLPALYQEILQEFNRPDGSLAGVGRIISRDVGMTAKILQLVNSSFFGLARHVSSPGEAAALLGMDTLRGLVLGSRVFSEFDASGSRLDLEALWRHSGRVAALARKLAEMESLEKRWQDDAFLAGMLHDVGKLMLASSLPREYDALLRDNGGQGGALWRLEQTAFGCTHAEIGAYLMGLWGLPATIVEALAYHHYPSHSAGASCTPLTVVHLANVMVAHGSGEEAVAALDLDYLERIGRASRVEAWRDAARRLFEEEVGDE